MPEPVLTVLKFVFLALVYLFFFRVVRAVWVVDLAPKPRTTTGRATPRTRRRAAGAPSPAGAPPAARTATPGTFELRVLDPELLRGQTFVITDESTVGRTPGCQVHLDETTVSQLHARLFVRDGRLFVEDMGSTNGTFVNRAQIKAASPLRRGDRVSFGQAHLEVRR